MNKPNVETLRAVVSELEAADEHMRQAEMLAEDRTAVLKLRHKLNVLLGGLKNKLHWAESNAKREASK